MTSPSAVGLPRPDGGDNNDNNNKGVLSVESRVFAEKAARSVSEIQHGINSVADVVVFLEILGYDDRSANAHGFEGLAGLAKYVYPFLDHYQNPGDVPEDWSHVLSAHVDDLRKRVSEALAVHAPWLGALVILNIAGFSLWMAQGLPADIAVSFVAGVFLGLFITEGPLQMFGRLFYMYSEQRNVGEVRRSVARSYATTAAIIAVAGALVVAYSVANDTPAELTVITLGAMASVALHRMSFNVIFASKRASAVLLSYGSASLALVASFYLLPVNGTEEVATRYFTSLAIAFGILLAFAAYYHYALVIRRGAIARPSSSTSSSAAAAAPSAGMPVPSFYSPPTSTDKTVRSRFSVQAWEALPYLVYGTAYLLMLLGDRVLSWVFNPHVVVASNGILLPMTFNAEYHVGADIALLVLVPAAVLQYVLLAPLHSLVHNRTLGLRVGDGGAQLDGFIRSTYKKLVLLAIAAAAASACTLYVFAPEVVSVFGGTENSAHVLRNAALGNIAMSVFVANAAFMMFLGRTKVAAYLAMAGAAAVALIGTLLAQDEGFAQLAVAYAFSCTGAAVASTVLLFRMLRSRPATRLLARYS
jgi:hypothetical protein